MYFDLLPSACKFLRDLPLWTVDQLMYTCIIKALNKSLWLKIALLVTALALCPVAAEPSTQRGSSPSVTGSSVCSSQTSGVAAHMGCLSPSVARRCHGGQWITVIYVLAGHPFCYHLPYPAAKRCDPQNSLLGSMESQPRCVHPLSSFFSISP